MCLKLCSIDVVVALFQLLDILVYNRSVWQKQSTHNANLRSGVLFSFPFLSFIFVGKHRLIAG